MEQSNQTGAPLINTAPSAVASHSSPANRSPVAAANWRQVLSCDSASTLTPNRESWLNAGQVRDVLLAHTEASGGSSETGMNELAAMPTGRPSQSAHRAVTPVGKCP